MLGNLGPVEYAEHAKAAMKLLGWGDDKKLTPEETQQFNDLVVSIARTARKGLNGPKKLESFLVGAIKGVQVTDTPIEIKLRDALAKHGLGKLLKPQYRVGPYWIDLAVPQVRLAIECDGRDYHTSPADRERDQHRDDYLAKLGWRVKHFRGRDIVFATARCAEIVIAEIGVLKQAGLEVLERPTPKDVAADLKRLASQKFKTDRKQA